VGAKPLFATTTTEDGLSISTDKDDYQPGDTVHVLGTGWQPGDVLNIVLTDDPLTHDPHTWTATVAPDGTFQDSTYIVDEGDLDVTFTLAVTSSEGRTLTVVFTDGKVNSASIVTRTVNTSPTTACSTTNATSFQPATNVCGRASIASLQGNTTNQTTDFFLVWFDRNDVLRRTSPKFSLPANPTLPFVAEDILPPSESGGNQGPTGSNWKVKVCSNTDCNGAGNTHATANFTFVNVAPVAVNDIATTNQGNAVTVNVLTNDTDANGDALGVVNLTQPAAGTGAAVLNSDGTVTYTPPAGFSGNASFTYKASDGLLTSGNTATVTITVNAVTPANRPPVLAAIGNKSGDEEVELSFTATATDPDVPANTLTFSLDAGAPSGATINSSTGVFRWTPTEAQGPGAYPVSVRVSDGILDDFENVQITVNDVNKAPVVTAITDKSVNEGDALTFTAVATDADLPANNLTFSLQAGTDPVPSGASINGSTGVFTWTPTEAQGPSVYEFKVRATDNGTPVLFGEANVKITVNEVNQAPVLEAIGNKSVDEGSALTFTAKAADADVPANTLTFSLDGAPAGASINATTGAFSWTPADDEPTGTPSDDKTFKVIVKDNGTPQLSDEEAITVTVNNVGPIVTVEPDKTGKEGEVIPLKGEFKDPGADDHTWSWEYVEGFNAGATCSITGATTTLTPTISCTDDGVVKVTLTVRDDDTGEGSDYLLLTLSNVAPSATSLTAPTKVDEGSSIDINLAGVIDPSSVDLTSLHYAFDCGSGYGAATDYAHAGTANTYSCPTDDNGTRTVKGKVFDKDGGVSTERSATVQIDNVAPTATFNAPSPVNEGSNIALSLDNADDASTVDKSTGFTYAFDCGAGYGAFGPTSSASCPTTDNGSRTVKGKIRDKDDGVTEYTSSVQINNVAPTITSWTPAVVDPLVFGSTVNFTAAFTDPGTADTHKAEYDCGTGTYSSPATAASPFTYSCTFSSIGQKTIRIRITDDDNGSDYKSQTFTVVYTFSGFFAPVDRPNIMNISKVGQAIPLKWRLTDASGRGITGVTGVTVQAYDLSCSLGSTTDVVEEYAGNSGLQDLGEGYYQFNWKTPASYLNSCKKIALTFGTGGLGYTEKPGAYFTFKK